MAHPLRVPAMLEALGHAVIATDMEGILLYWNEAARELYGFAPEEVLGKQIYYVLPAALGDHEIDAMMRDFAAGKPWDGVLRIRRKDGEWIPTVHSDRVLRDESGTPVAIVSASFAVSRVEEVVSVEKKDVVTKDVARVLLRSLRREGHENAGRMREAGKAFAKKANCPGITVYLETFAAAGLGDLKLDDEAPGRIVVSGSDLFERQSSAAHPTCHLPLGFLEGALASLTARDALGTEIQCQSMGAPRCVFVVRAR